MRMVFFKKSSENYWTTEDGKLKPIGKLTDEELEDAIHRAKWYLSGTRVAVLSGEVNNQSKKDLNCLSAYYFLYKKRLERLKNEQKKRR